MRLNIIIFNLLFAISISSTYGQETGVICGDGHFSISSCDNNDRSENRQNLEEKYVHCIVNNSSKISAPVILPIIFHVINKPTDPNISINLLEEIISNLNSAFSNIGTYYLPQGVDSEILFCLATRDPKGSPTNGVNHVISPYDVISDNQSFRNLTDAVHWDTREYINIYLVNNVVVNGKGVAGFANYPTSHGRSSDGIIISKNIINGNLIITPTLIHEMGHYLGLIHTFEHGCKNDNCLVDGDKVCDTAPDRFSSPFPCNIGFNSCNTDEHDLSDNNPFRPKSLGGLGDQPDNHNYMDYYSCKDRFTKGQKDRMHFFIQNARYSLLTSKACNEPCFNPAVAGFSTDKTTYTSGEVIGIQNSSTNADHYQWYLNHTLISSNEIPDLNVLTQGDYDLTLVCSSDDPRCDSDSMTVNFSINCPVKAAMNYSLRDTVLIFEHDMIPEQDYTFVLRTQGSTIYTSVLSKDSVILVPDSYTLCLTTSNPYCRDSVCRLIIVLPRGAEICNNGWDDDDDGYVDEYDTDCSCTDHIFNAGCKTDCEYVPDDFQKIKMKMKWSSDVIKNNNSGIFFPNFVIDPINSVCISPYTFGGFPKFDNGIKIINLMDGRTIKNHFIQTTSFTTTGHIAIGDVDHDKITDIFIQEPWGALIRKDIDGNNIWRAPIFEFIDIESRYPKLIDFNSDNIPEVYAGNKILNARSGATLINTNLSAGCNPAGSFDLCGLGAHSVAGDLTNSPGLELACGNMVYEVSINNINGEIGNTFKVIAAPYNVKDGFTSIADIDEDGLTDVLVVRSNVLNDGGIWVWNPRNQTIIAEATAGERGGIAFVGNVDEDCFPEIGVTFINELRMYKYNGSTSLQLMYNIPIIDGSGFTGITMFDFNQDGRNELVYRDERYLRIIEGNTGITIDSFAVFSGTAAEYPIVADIDDDGQAEILVNGYTERRDSFRIFCFESTGAPWAPARKVWNQTGYHITNVNDDLTIPRYPQNQATFFDTDSCGQFTCPQVYNNFMVQATYRTQKGCVKWPAADLSVDLQRYECSSDSLICYMIINNNSDKELSLDSVAMSVYSRIPDLTATPLERRMIHFKRDINGKIITWDTIRMTFVLPDTDTKTLLFRINDPGDSDAFSSIRGRSEILECNYENNSDVIDIQIAPLTLDLGPDIVKCRTEIFTLHAGSGFVAYLWSDFTRDSIYSASETGIHSVTTTDQCGRTYHDEVIFNINANLKPDLGDDITLCEGDTMAITVSSAFDWVRWLPADKVGCDTCYTTTLKTDTAFKLMIIGSISGCIDMDTLGFEVAPLIRREMAVSFCDGESRDFYGLTIDKAGIYEHRTGQCDSLITLTAVVNSKDSTTLTMNICQGDSIEVLGKWYNTSVETILASTNINGCDSIIALSLQVGDTIISEQNITICSGDSILIHGLWTHSGGLYSGTYTASTGCDSVSQVELILSPLLTGNETITICEGDSVLIRGVWHNKTGTYANIYQTTNGCDSISNISLTLLPSSYSIDTIHICSGDSVLIHGLWTHSGGLYSSTYTSSTGCDSVSQVELVLSQLLSESVQITICEGDTVRLHGKLISAPGLYVDTIDVAGDCKREIHTQVAMLQSTQESLSIVLCPDSIIVINGQAISEGGNYIFDLITSQGCDSTLTVKVNQLNQPVPPVIDIHCKEERYTATYTPQLPWRHAWDDGSEEAIYYLNQGGALSLRIYTDSGCEQIYRYNLPQIPKLSDIPKLGDQVIRDSDMIPLTVNLDPEVWKIRWSPSSLFHCDTCFTTEVTTPTDTTINILITHITGCSFEQQLRIIRDIKSTIGVPNVFNPQSTTGNQEWKVQVPAGYTIAEANVYDRWGNRVFHSGQSISLAWDGTLNGHELLPGVYVYHIKIVDGLGKVSVMFGDVTLLR